MASTIDVLVGTLGRPHGLRGEVSVQVRTDEPDRRFAVGAPILLDGKLQRTVASARWHSGVLLLRLEGVSDRTGAEALRGREVWAQVPEDEVPAEDDAWYDRQIVGLAVRDASAAEVGTVSKVLHLPAQDVLEVDTPHGKRLVPFVKELVPIVDLDAGFVQCADLAGLLDGDESED